MNNGLISREDLKEALAKEIKTNDLGLWLKILSVIDNTPTVPLPDFKAGYKQAIIDGKTNFARPQGEWELHGMIYYCSECGHDCGESGDNFCGNCGADMRKGAKNECGCK